jgi:hypothetical protein
VTDYHAFIARREAGDDPRTFLRDHQDFDPRGGPNIDQKYAILQAITGGRSAGDKGATIRNDGGYGTIAFGFRTAEKISKNCLDKDERILENIENCFIFERVSRR